MKLDIPTENQEQKALIQWAAHRLGLYPELEWLHAVPNGGKRSKIEAACLIGEGVKAGVPDMCLPVSRGGYHGLYIELKRIKGGKVSNAQERWIDGLTANGYCAKVCKGWQEAAKLIIWYLTEAKED
jgi:hypothetical protein